MPAISRVSEPRCFKCGKEISNEEVAYCEDCSKQEKLYERGFPVFNYSEEMQNSIAMFKYQNRRDFAEYYAKEMYMRWREQFMEIGFDVLVPVPISKEKRRKRGYNQAELIARELGKYINVPVDNKLLMRRLDTAPQKELSNKERICNLKNAFFLTDLSKRYNKILIIDDIYTTGATIDACTNVLKQIGTNHIYFASVCIGKGY